MPKRPRDVNQLAKLIVDIATGEAKDDFSEQKKRPYCPKGQPGGLKGGKARSKLLTRKQRSEIARIAAAARWKKSR